MGERDDDDAAWAELPWHAWGDSLATLHMWTQIVGKIRLAASPPASHWWHSSLYVTARGLTTSAIPYRDRVFQVDFDLIADRLLLAASDGRTASVELASRPVADFYHETFAALRSLDIDLAIMRRPVEVAEAIPFDEDHVHATYDPANGRAFFGALTQAHRLLAAFRGPFAGKVSPVQFWWGSFDLAVTRFSGRRAPTHPGGAPNYADWVQEEAYSHEVSSAGWWPQHPTLGPAFYAYAYPEPPGFRDGSVRPAAAYFDGELGEFILRHEDLRLGAEHESAVTDFLEDTYALAADLARWPRSELEPADYPGDGRPTRAWSTSTTGSGTP
jgi:hypothetical protein